jgi:hypothetical protein
MQREHQAERTYQKRHAATLFRRKPVAAKTA